MYELIFSGSFILLMAIMYCLYSLNLQKKVNRIVKRHECLICKANFSESIFEFTGKPSKKEKSILDNFQKRYAKYRIICMECHSVNICADNGMPLRAMPIQDLPG